MRYDLASYSVGCSILRLEHQIHTFYGKLVAEEKRAVTQRMALAMVSCRLIDLFHYGLCDGGALVWKAKRSRYVREDFEGEVGVGSEGSGL